MPKGRPRKPEVLKVLHGDYDKDPQKRPDFVLEAKGSPVKPPHFAGLASQYWDEMIPALEDMGIVSFADTPQLEALVEWRVLYRHAIDDDDINSAVKAHNQFHKIASLFGMTPSDRAKIVVAPVKAEDPAKKYLA